MTRASHLLNFGQIKAFNLLVLTAIFCTESFHMRCVVRTAKLSDYFLGDISANIFTIVRLVFLFLFLDLSKQLKARCAVDWILDCWNWHIYY